MDVGRGFTPAVNPPQPVILSGAKNLTYFCNVGLRPDPSRALEDDTFGVGRKVAQDEKHPPVILSEAKNLTCYSRYRRARRVKKICQWHIFSQSGKQAMLATRAEREAPALHSEILVYAYRKMQ